MHLADTFIQSHLHSYPRYKGRSCLRTPIGGNTLSCRIWTQVTHRKGGNLTSTLSSPTCISGEAPSILNVFTAFRATSAWLRLGVGLVSLHFRPFTKLKHLVHHEMQIRRTRQWTVDPISDRNGTTFLYQYVLQFSFEMFMDCCLKRGRCHTLANMALYQICETCCSGLIQDELIFSTFDTLSMFHEYVLWIRFQFSLNMTATIGEIILCNIL